MPFSGRGGKAYSTVPGGTSYTEILDVKQWGFTFGSDNKSYTSSSTAGMARREAGNQDVTNGSIDVYAQSSGPSVLVPGTKYRLKLLETGTKFHIIEAIIDSINPLVNVESGDIVGYQISFSGDGTYTPPT